MQEECLATGFLDFIDYCLSLVHHQRDAYPAPNKAAQVRLQFMLRYRDCPPTVHAQVP